MKQEFFCVKCMQHLHVKFLAYKFQDGKKSCCISCESLVKERAMKPEAKTTIKTNAKIKYMDKVHVDKRREFEFKKDLKRLHSQYDYSLEDLI